MPIEVEVAEVSLRSMLDAQCSADCDVCRRV